MSMNPPYDPMCGRYAADMEELDTFWAGSQKELDAVPAEQRRDKRIAYVIREEGTLNPDNGHFLCDKCYIAAGCPAGTSDRWVCP